MSNMCLCVCVCTYKSRFCIFDSTWYFWSFVLLVWFYCFFYFLHLFNNNIFILWEIHIRIKCVLSNLLPTPSPPISSSVLPPHHASLPVLCAPDPFWFELCERWMVSLLFHFSKGSYPVWPASLVENTGFPTSVFLILF